MTEIYGTGDGLIKLDGDIAGEVTPWGADGEDCKVLMICSDGTILEVKYGKGGAAIWGITIVHAGFLLERIVACRDGDGRVSSDIACFKDGLTFVYAAKEWEYVS